MNSIERPREDPGDSAEWHRAPEDELFGILGSTPGGLPGAEARERLESLGPNEIPEGAARSVLRVIGAQFRGLMMLVLFGAALASAWVGEPLDTWVILGIVLLNAAIGSLQELRAERAVAALRELARPEAWVRRDGAWVSIPSRDLVPGDLLRVEAGNVVGADARLLEVTDLAVDEAALTGESMPVEKRVGRVDRGHVPLGDRSCMVHAGTLVARGRGEALVVATGSATEVGKIADLLRAEERAATPLQRRLDRFGRQVAIGVLGICALVFLAGVMRGEPAGLMLLTAVSLGVAAVPEALPAVVSVSLALGARRMVSRRVLVRRLSAVETLGSVTYACVDKTGTLTEGRMAAEVYVIGDQRHGHLPDPGAIGDEGTRMGRALALSNEVSGDIGDPTDLALREAATSAGYRQEALEALTPRVASFPFDAVRRLASTIHRDGSRGIVSVKGAPEAVLAHCRSVDRASVLEQVEGLAREGLRVLAVADRRLKSIPTSMDSASIECDLEWIGLVGLLDPPREGAAEAVAECRSAGIVPVMITGDHPSTAAAIARRLGIQDEGGGTLVGQELEGVEGARLEELVHDVRVHARVSPEGKIKIVRALQARGEVVAMTGDGVNDAPALKRAEIGVAMGLGGTDVAREAADMVLLDDQFRSIVGAVREGRRVYDNVTKFVKYTMTSNAGEIWTLVLAPLFGLPLPLLPIQILWINLVTDGLPGLALGAEPVEPDVMKRPPRPPSESLLARGLGVHVLWCGLWIGVLTIATQSWAIHRGSDAWQTLAFSVLTFAQLVHVFSIRSEHESILKRGLGSNLPLLVAVLATVLLQLAVIYVPFFQGLLHTQALSGSELAVCLLVPLAVLAAVEFEKAMFRHRRSARP